MGSILACFSKDNHKDAHHTANDAQSQSQKKEVSQQDMTILKLKTAQDKIFAQRKNLQKNADKSADEAKQFIAEKKKDRAIFALKRQKLFEHYLKDMDDKYLILQKSIGDLESAIMTSTYTELLKETNNLMKEIESANHLEELQEISADMKEREQRTKEFNALFKDNDIEDEELNDLYNKFEGQVVEEKIQFVNREKVNVTVQPQAQRNNATSQNQQQHRQEQKEPDMLEEQLEALAN